MKKYWDSLSYDEKDDLARKVGTSTEYLRMIFNGYKKAGPSLAKAIEAATAGAVIRGELRPDIYDN